MAQQVPLSSPSLQVWRTSHLWQLVLLGAILGVTTAGQTPQQQYVYGSIPTTTSASQLAAYTKNQNGLLSAIAGSQLLPPFKWLRVFSVTSYGGILLLLLYLSRLRGLSSTACLWRAASLALLISVCLFETTGCGGGATTAAPQNTPSLQVAGGTPLGTSIITLTPSVTTSTGTTLPGIPPIQLTLTVQ